MRQVILLLACLMMSCQDSRHRELPQAMASVEKLNMNREENQVSPTAAIDGLYHRNIRMGRFIVIQESRIYFFDRRNPLELRKDEEYDIKFENGKILYKYNDTKVILKDGKGVELDYRDTKYQRLDNMSELFDAIHIQDTGPLQEVKDHSSYRDDSIIRNAFQNIEFIKKSKMLESDNISFWQMAVNILDQK